MRAILSTTLGVGGSFLGPDEECGGVGRGRYEQFGVLSLARTSTSPPRKEGPPEGVPVIRTLSLWLWPSW